MSRLWSAKFSIAAVLGLLIVGAAYAVPPGTNDEISARLAPFGTLCKTGDDCGSASSAAASGPLSGKEVYDQFCFACHAVGVGGAPLFADAAQWAPRIDKGIEVLYTSTLNGINTMPAKGTCMSCSDDELKQTVDYMVAEAQ
ncbi:MAG: cytochrome c5 family protein [Pseudomonadales bacterium]